MKAKERPSCIYPSLIESQALELARVTRLRDNAKDDLDAITDEITTEVLRAIEPTSGKPLFTNDKSREIEIRRRQRESNEYIAALNRFENEERDRLHCVYILERLRGEFSVWKIERREAIVAAEVSA